MSLGKFSNRKNSEPTFQSIENKRMKKNAKIDANQKAIIADYKQKKKQFYHQETNTFEEKPVVVKEEKQLEVLKAEPKKNDITFETLHADLLKINEKLNEKQEEIVSEDEHKFVESIETVDTGGNVINEIIRLRHTDIVIVVTNDSITLFESLEDYDKKKEHLGLFVFEESEKIPIDEEDEAEKAYHKQHPELNP